MTTRNQDAETMGAILVVLIILLFIGLMGWWKISTWNECRETNSFFYCWRVLK